MAISQSNTRESQEAVKNALQERQRKEYEEQRMQLEKEKQKAEKKADKFSDLARKLEREVKEKNLFIGKLLQEGTLSLWSRRTAA